MKKIFHLLAVALVGSLALSSCNGFGIKGLFGGDSDSTATETQAKEEAPQFDEALCRELIAEGAQKKLTTERLEQCLEQMALMMDKLEARVKHIEEMPAGEDRCNEAMSLTDDKDKFMFASMFKCLETSPQQPGYTNEIGNKFKQMDIRKRSKTVNLALAKIISECQ